MYVEKVTIGNVKKDSLIMDGIELGTYIIEATYGYNKLWSSDSGRNLKGSKKGTLVGIFPKLEITFRALDKDELHLLAPHFDNAEQTFQYYDDSKGGMLTIKTYSNDWKVTSNNTKRVKSFGVNFIANERRTL